MEKKSERPAKKASALADSADAAKIAAGLAMISEIFEDALNAQKTGAAEFGFLDNALFIARKHASHPDPSVREGVTRVLLAIGGMSVSGREAADETADEIAMQPSDEARAAAAKYFAEIC